MRGAKRAAGDDLTDDTPTISATELDPARLAAALDARFANRVIALLPEAIGEPLSFARAQFDPGGEDPEPFTLEGDTAIVSIQGPLLQRAFTMCGLTLVDGYDAIEERIRAAFASDDVSSVLLDIDSPGGYVAGVSELSRAIRSMSIESGKPIHARASEMAASAAYWIAASTGGITLPATGEVGSIGTIVVGINRHQEIAARGQRLIIAASPAGKLLAASSMIDPADAAKMSELATRLQGRVEELTALFAADVAAFRGMTSEAVVGLNAAMFGGQKAVDAGLADAVGSRSMALSMLRSKVKKKGYSMSTGAKAEELSAPVALELSDEQKRLIALGSQIEALTGAQGEAGAAVVSAWKEGAERVAGLERRVKLEALNGRLAAKYAPAQRFATGADGLPDPTSLHPDFDAQSLAVFDARTAAALPHSATKEPPAAKAADSSDEENIRRKAAKAGVKPEFYKAAMQRHGVTG